MNVYTEPSEWGRNIRLVALFIGVWEKRKSVAHKNLEIIQFIIDFTSRVDRYVKRSTADYQT